MTKKLNLTNEHYLKSAAILARISLLAILFVNGSNHLAWSQVSRSPISPNANSGSLSVNYPQTNYPVYANQNRPVNRGGGMVSSFATAPVSQFDRGENDPQEFRSMSPQTWDDPNLGRQPLGNPFAQTGSQRDFIPAGNGSPIRSVSGPNTFNSNQARNPAPNGLRPTANGSPTWQSSEPMPNSAQQQAASQISNQANPFQSVSSSRLNNPLQRNVESPNVPATTNRDQEDLFGSPPVPQDIRRELDSEPGANFELAPRDQDQSMAQDPAATKQDDQRSILDFDSFSELAPPAATVAPEINGAIDLPATNQPGYSDSLTRALMNQQQELAQPLLSPPAVSPQSAWATGQPSQPYFPPVIDPAQVYPPSYPSNQGPLPSAVHRPEVGQRGPFPTIRNDDSDDYGQTFDFEEKYQDYPSLKEILATGRYFGSASVLLLRPTFQANTAIFREQSGVAENFEFGYSTAPEIRIGFESKFGPGIELNYWSLRDVSQPSTFVSDGVERGRTSVFVRGANQESRLTAANLGDRLISRHRYDVDVAGVSFFKEVQLKRARINGKYGLQSVRVTQELNSQLVNAAGLQAGTLRSRTDTDAIGPQFHFEYFRPVGHTKIELIVGVGGSVLFGDQTQRVENSISGNLSRVDEREIIMTTEFFGGAQYRQLVRENRYLFVRGGVNYQVWMNGGTAVAPQDDFGLRGYVLTIGVNR